MIRTSVLIALFICLSSIESLGQTALLRVLKPNSNEDFSFGESVDIEWTFVHPSTNTGSIPDKVSDKLMTIRLKRHNDSDFSRTVEFRKLLNQGVTDPGPGGAYKTYKYKGFVIPSDVPQRTDYYFEVSIDKWPGDYSTREHNSSSFTIYGPPPNASTTVRATSIESTSITLEWDQIPQTTAYDIFDCEGRWITSPSENFYKVTGLSPSTEYKFSVNGRNVLGQRGPASQCYTVSTSEENYPPNDLQLASSTIEEGKGIGTVVGELKASDSNVDDAHTFSLISGDLESFTILGNQLLTAEVFDFETKSQYELVVRVSDREGDTFDKNFQIQVLDVDEVAPELIEQVPADNSQEVPPIDQLSFTFDEPIVKGGSGNLSIFSESGSLVEQASVDATEILVDDSKVIWQLAERLGEQTSYYVLVDAGVFLDVNGNPFSGISDIQTWNFTTGKSIEPPVGLTATTQSSSEILLSWQSVESAVEYQIFNCNGTEVGSTEEANFLVMGLEAATEFSFKVKSVSGTGSSSEYTACVQATTDVPIPAVPSAVEISDITDDGMRLSWQQVSFATGYEIYDCAETPTLIASTSVTTVDIQNLNQDTEYGFSVRAINNHGKSDFSSCTTGSTLCGPEWGLVMGQFTQSTRLLGEVRIEGQPASANDQIAVYASGELRQISNPVLDPETGVSLVNMLIPGEGEESLSFIIWDQSECLELVVKETILSAPGEDLGSFPNDLIPIYYLANTSPEVLNPIEDIEWEEDKEQQFTIPTDFAFDADEDELMFEVSLSPQTQSISFDKESRTLKGVPTQADVGEKVVTVVITDPFGASAWDSFNITILNVNDPPVYVGDQEDISTDEDAEFRYTFSSELFEDEDEEDLTIDLTDFPLSMEFKKESLTLEGVPEQSDVGEYILKLSATDAAGLMATKEIKLTIHNVNDAPEGILLTKSEIPENALEGTVIGELQVVDPDENDEHTFELIGNSGSFDVEHQSENDKWVLLSKEVFDFESQPVYVVELKVTDSAMESFTKSLIIKVTDIPEPILDSPDELDFGPVALGYFSELIIGIENDGDSELSIDEVSLNTTGGFTIQGNPQGATIQPNEVLSIVVKFEPVLEQNYSGEVSIKTNAGDKTVFLMGSGAIITDLDPDEVSSDILIYPNPVSQYATVDLTRMREIPDALLIFDTLGKLVFEKKIDEEKVLKIDLRELRHGQYVIQIVCAQKTYGKKILIDK